MRAITILTGDDFEFKFATMCRGAGHMNFWAFWSVIPASMTSGSLKKSMNLTWTLLLTSALNLYVTFAAMCGFVCKVFNACSD